MSRGRKWLLGVAVLVVIGAVLETQKPAPTPESLAADSVRTVRQARDREDRAMIREAKDKMTARLKDPSSAEYSDVYVSRASGAPVVCGQVNAKNGFGGYTGKKMFIMLAGGIPVGEDDLEAQRFVSQWNSHCVSKS